MSFFKNIISSILKKEEKEDTFFNERKELKKKMEKKFKNFIKDWKLENRDKNFVDFIKECFPENIILRDTRYWIDSRCIEWKNIFDEVNIEFEEISYKVYSSN